MAQTTPTTSLRERIDSGATSITPMPFEKLPSKAILKGYNKQGQLIQGTITGDSKDAFYKNALNVFVSVVHPTRTRKGKPVVHVLSPIRINKSGQEEGTTPKADLLLTEYNIIRK